MVGAAGIVASTINNRHQRRESRTSQAGDAASDHHGYGRHGSKATISEAVGSRIVPPPPHLNPGFGHPGGGAGGGGDRGGGGAAKEPEIIPEKLSLQEQIKFYVSLTLGIVASMCVFALLFLIPLVVEPSISTLLADFDPEAATCVAYTYSYAIGLSKCGEWSSCREGCTSTPSQCHQIRVHYRKAHKQGFAPLQNFTMLDDREREDPSRWDTMNVTLLVNAKGCGYPPRIQCDEFGETYGQVGRTFPCYYSRANERLVVTDYNWQETAYPLVISLGLPTSLFAISIAVLSFWYCPSCEERGKNKRPCRSRYQTTRLNEDLIYNIKGLAGGKSAKDKKDDKDKENGKQLCGAQSPPIVQQPRGKHEKYRPSSPSLATISSRDTTVSSVNSLDDGWQSPPSPPPRANSRMNASKSNLTARARKL